MHVNSYGIRTSIRVTRYALSANFSSQFCPSRLTSRKSKYKPSSYCRFKTTNAFHDSYLWLRDLNNNKVQSLIEKENKKSDNYFRQHRPFQQALYLEMRKRITHSDDSIPERIGAYDYFMKSIPYENFPVFVRQRHNEMNAKPEVILNQNELSKNFSNVNIGCMKISPDDRFLFFSMDTTGREIYDGFLRDLKYGKTMKIPSMMDIQNAEWSQCTKPYTLYYTKTDEYRRPSTVYSHTLLSKTKDKLIYQDEDPSFYVDVALTKDQKYITINSNSKTTSEVYVINAMKPQTKPYLLQPKNDGSSYFVDHAGDGFYIVTNADKASNYKIMKAMDNQLDHWECIVPDTKETKIEDLDVFDEYIVLYEKHLGLPRVRVLPKKDPTETHIVELQKDQRIGVLVPGVNRMYHSNSFRFIISTPFIPEIVYDYNMETKNLSVLRKTGVTEDNQPIFHFENDYSCHRVNVESHDGLNIPLTLMHHNSLSLDGNNPCLMFGYGAYGVSTEPDFQVEKLSMLERGWILAIPHVRGGGELGLPWYQDGKLIRKKNSFYDFITCAEYLIQKKYTHPSIMAASASSAGGLILGYLANERPDLFKALIMKVPFVDILSTMMDSNLPLTIHEYDEWGNPNDPKIFDYIKSYSPCDNIKTQNYPAMYVTGSLLDQRVNFWEPLKWVMKLRKYNGSTSNVLLQINDEEGHFGPDGKLEQIQKFSEEIAFVYDAMGLKWNASRLK